MPLAFKRPARVTHRQVAGKAAAAEQGAAVALQAIANVGTEWRAFAAMTFWQRAVWLCTGRGPHITKSESNHADLSASVRS